VKELLSRERRRFTAKNVDEDEAAYEELVALGFRAVPVTLVNGRAIKGFDEPALLGALAAVSRL
jgi:glutaredoxin